MKPIFPWLCCALALCLPCKQLQAQGSALDQALGRNRYDLTVQHGELAGSPAFLLSEILHAETDRRISEPARQVLSQCSLADSRSIASHRIEDICM
jgi:hypothetical protein